MGLDCLSDIDLSRKAATTLSQGCEGCLCNIQEHMLTEAPDAKLPYSQAFASIRKPPECSHQVGDFHSLIVITNRH